jgi:TolB-like protein/Tfp pilus assembly protein PilF
VLVRRVSLHFGPFRLDPRARVLYRGDTDVQLPPKAAETLVVLVENAGELVEKEELLRRVWPDVVVGEGSLTRTISVLRKALGTRGNGEEYIVTASKRGYRFTEHIERSELERAAPERARVLAVLPFGGSDEDAWLADGLTEEMITQLSRLDRSQLRVIALGSAVRFGRSGRPLRDAAPELGASLVLTGSVRHAGERVRITAQLSRVDDEALVWAESYDRSLGDILRLQSDVARSIAREVQVKLSPRQERVLAAAAAVSPKAYEAYVRGRHFWNRRTEESMRRSIALFQEAIRLEPRHALARSGIADAYTMLACRGMGPPRELLPLAKAEAEQALALEPELAEPRGSLAHIRLHTWDWDGLEGQFLRAIDASPSQAIIRYWYAEFLMASHRPDEAIAQAEEGRRNDPLSPLTASSLSMILYLGRQYDHAVEVLELALELDDSHFLPHLRLGLVRIQQGRPDAALEEMKRAVALSAGSTETRAALAIAHAAAGNLGATRELVEGLLHERSTQFVLPYNLAKVHAAAGDAGEALAWLRTALEELNPDLIELGTEPLFDPIRRSPEFGELLRRLPRG